MEEILLFLVNYEVWIYFVLGVVGIIYFRKLLVAWREWRSSIFGLEREKAQREFTGAMSITIIVFLLALAEFIVVSFAAPTFPYETALATPTIDLLATPTTTVEPGLVGVSGGTTVSVSDSGSEGCVEDIIEWINPLDGGTIIGMVALEGTVNIPNLGFYKYEYSSYGSDNWVTIAANNTIKIEENLGGENSEWDTAQLVPGDYQLRIVVADNENNILPPCVISITVEGYN
jgi:hypothetical protein